MRNTAWSKRASTHVPGCPVLTAPRLTYINIAVRCVKENTAGNLVLTDSTITPKGAAVGYSDLSSTTRTTFRWINFAAASLLAAVLAGCGGGGGGGSTDTAVVTPPPAAATGPTVAAPTGAAPITLTASTPAATFAALTPAVPAVSVSIASAPKVAFSLTDGNGNAIIGMGYTTQTATATLPSLSNIRFSFAKLVPGTNGSPNKWVS